MASQDIAKYRENAEIYKGHEICKQKIIDFQAELGFPTGILRLNDIIEFGYNRQAGFVWILQKEKTEHRFKKIGNTVSYDTEITTFAEHHKMRKITGIKSKEFLIWVPISDMYISDPASGKINFKTYTGLGRNLPVSGFLLEDEQEEDKKKKKEGKK
ncbi:DUF538 domain-containing protein [Cinnamomum micranthum f. kanehirae]|uniref:DUF538 domain-containing protein n=1 Tax=Cinnamomum micranthum f. kanehirae TaxID=337451 RepID=A0A443P6R0_9MAGN|nr:DUF538 domain-containing protein [Cinnamomum micranthum f. kanehirae]